MAISKSFNTCWTVEELELMNSSYTPTNLAPEVRLEVPAPPRVTPVFKTMLVLETCKLLGVLMKMSPPTGAKIKSAAETICGVLICVVKTGEVPNTKAPLPVSSPITLASPTEVVVAVKGLVPLPSTKPVSEVAPVPP